MKLDIRKHRAIATVIVHRFVVAGGCLAFEGFVAIEVLAGGPGI